MMCGDSGFVVAEKCSTGTGTHTPIQLQGRGGMHIYSMHGTTTASPDRRTCRATRSSTRYVLYMPPSPTPSPRDPLVWCWSVRTALGRKLRCSVTRLERADGQPSGPSQPACQDALARRAPPNHLEALSHPLSALKPRAS